jgi:hypothetical protein
MAVEFSIDFKNFEMGFLKATMTLYPEAAKKAFFQAGALLIRDAITEMPTVPKKTGHLRREQLVIPAPDQIGVWAGFNTPYAARVHEAPNTWQWSEPGSGPKFLESKLIKNRDKYLKFAADKMTELIK